MKRLTAALLAVGLASSSAAAFAQSSTYYPPANGYNSGYNNNGYQQSESYIDYARVIRVDPVLDGRYGNTSSYGASGQRCYQTQSAGSYAGGYPRDNQYGSYRNDGYRSGGYNDPYGYPQAGTDTGRTIATVVGGIAGAVLGSKVGGGTGAYAATAIGSMVGGMAGRQVYDRTQANRNVRPGVVTVCDPEPVNSGYAGGYGAGGYSRASNGQANAYDVTYEYNGRRYTRRMNYHPGERVQVRVEVAPQ